jgi:glycosyltransferase involved in cell wall biosynthesis
VLRVAVIIPHYNDVVRLERCLAVLVPQADENVEIVVADNNSTDPINAIKAAFPTVRFVVQIEPGAGPARNLGVAETSAPWLAFIDADCVAASDWIAVARRIACEDHVIGGRVDVFSETPAPMSGAEAFEAIFAFKMRAYLERDQFLGAGNLITSRAVFEAVGGFRPAVSEDKDWSQRAAKAKFTLAFEDDFAVSHPARQDWLALRHKWRRLAAESYLLHRTEAGSRLSWALRGLAMAPSIVVHAPQIITASGLNTGEKARALVTLVRLRLARMIWMLGQSLTGRADA